jgi:hypothetical protein
MRRGLLATMLLILAVSPAFGKFGVEKIEACHGKLGPVRKTLEFYPYDEIVFRFTLTGAKADDGTLDVGCTWSLFDDKGKEVLSEKPPFKGSLAFGIDALPYSLGFYLPETASPGEYALKVTLKDNVSGEETRFERKLKLKATEFAIVSPQFFYDAKFTVPAPVGGVVGQQLHYRLWIIGFDRAGGKVVNDMTVEVFDKDNKVVQSKPVHFRVEDDDEKRVKESPTLGFNGWMGLSKPGEFTLRITVTDRNSKKTATFEAPLKVMAP